MRSRRVPLLGLLFVLAVACQPSSPAATGSASPPAQSPSAPAATSYPLSLTDDAGRDVSLAAEPQRIVSLAPSNTEIVCALGACDRLVGVTDFDDYPAEVSDVPHVVIGAVVDVELVVEADPDLVIAAGNELTPSAVITQIADLDIPVLVLYPDTLDAVLDNITLVGEAINAPQAAAELTADMQYRIDVVHHAVPSVVPLVFYEVGVFEGTIYTAGENSFLASVIGMAGASPVTGDPLTTAIQLEDLIAADPAHDPSGRRRLRPVRSRPSRWRPVRAGSR